MEARVALQLASCPPLLPAQFQVKVPGLLVTSEGLPTVHRFVVGALVKVWPLALPHTPLMGGGGRLVLVRLNVAFVATPRAPAVTE